MFLEVTGGEELYRVKKTEGERRMKEQPSPFTMPYSSALAGEGQAFTFLSPFYPGCKRLRDSILSPFFHSYIFAMYKNEALWI